MEVVVAVSRAALKKKIEGWIEEAKVRLSLQSLRIEKSWDLKNEISKDGATKLMDFRCAPEYMSGHLRVNIEVASMCSDKVLRACCNHEMAHALVWEYARLAKSRCVTETQLVEGEEKLVESIARLLDD